MIHNDAIVNNGSKNNGKNNAVIHNINDAVIHNDAMVNMMNALCRKQKSPY